MFRWILPRETSFFDYFEQLARIAIATTKEFAAFAAGGADFSDRAVQIRQLEHDADDVAHECIEALHKTFITPIDRGDIHRLIKRLDDIVDAIHSATFHMVLYDLREIRSEARMLADVLMRATLEIEAAVKLMRNLKNEGAIQQRCATIYEREKEADGVVRGAVARLFKEEAERPIVAMQWKEIFETLEMAADRCEDVANVIEGILIEAS